MLGLLRDLAFNGLSPAAVDEFDSNTTYVGYNRVTASISDDHGVEESPVWVIKKIVKTGNITKIMYAEGNKSFIYLWSERYSYDYRY